MLVCCWREQHSLSAALPIRRVGTGVVQQWKATGKKMKIEFIQDLLRLNSTLPYLSLVVLVGCIFGSALECVGARVHSCFYTGRSGPTEDAFNTTSGRLCVPNVKVPVSFWREFDTTSCCRLLDARCIAVEGCYLPRASEGPSLHIILSPTCRRVRLSDPWGMRQPLMFCRPTQFECGMADVPPAAHSNTP